jgi:hypothetical protein
MIGEIRTGSRIYSKKAPWRLTKILGREFGGSSELTDAVFLRAAAQTAPGYFRSDERRTNQKGIVRTVIENRGRCGDHWISSPVAWSDPRRPRIQVRRPRAFCGMSGDRECRHPERRGLVARRFLPARKRPGSQTEVA